MNRVMTNAVARVGIDKVSLDHAVVRSMSHEVSHRLDDWKATHQKKSGRCWLFAALNLLRSDSRQRLGLRQFEFSQNFAMFYDKLERANYFLESVLDTADRPADDRLVTFLLDQVLEDGGQWDMAVGLFLKHGVVPKSVMPETQSSSNTAAMNGALKAVARDGARRLRDLVTSGADQDKVTAEKFEVMARIHSVLTIHLGVPPDNFEWQWTDDNGEFHRDGLVTPREFYERYVTINLDEYVCLVDDPRPEHPKGETLTVAYLGNIVGGREVRYLNVDIATAKTLAMETILSGEPVWFGCDHEPQGDRDLALWHANLFDYAGVYGFQVDADKEARVRYRSSAMTHAMLLTGVDVLDEVPLNWRVENSWGRANSGKGFYTMSDSWFDEYVFEVVVHHGRLSPAQRAALELPARVLPAWDPMGALA